MTAWTTERKCQCTLSPVIVLYAMISTMFCHPSFKIRYEHVIAVKRIVKRSQITICIFRSSEIFSLLHLFHFIFLFFYSSSSLVALRLFVRSYVLFVCFFSHLFSIPSFSHFFHFIQFHILPCFGMRCAQMLSNLSSAHNFLRAIGAILCYTQQTMLY